VGVGLQWLLQFMAGRFQKAPEHLYAEPPSGPPAVIVQRLEADLDELWSFVGKKSSEQWVWIAMDAVTRQVIAFHGGDRSGQSAQACGRRFPPYIGSRRCSIPITILLTRVSFPPLNTVQSPSLPARPITSNASTAHRGNEFPD